MLQLVYQKSKETKNLIILSALFIFFLILYIFLDFEGNGNYTIMTDNFGVGITIIHIISNILIAIMSSIMLTFSTINYTLTKVEPKGNTAIPFISFIFGILTFGCTSCVVAFLSAIGIAFTPLLLPNGNLIWKLIALLFVSIGFIWILYSIKNTKCKVKN
jgi:hypothetical protein